MIQKQDMKESELEQYFSSAYVGRLMGLTHETINKWLREGTIKGQKIGKHWRIPESEIRRMINPEAVPC
jgi:excisionase family DNA binding protein